MVLVTDRRRVRRMAWLRLLALAPVSLLVGHEAVYALQWGTGEGLRLAMTAGGHDSYWLAFSLVITAITMGAVAREAFRADRLRRRLRAIGASAASVGWPATGSAPRSNDDAGFGARAWLAEFRAIWPLLLALTLVGFCIQENLEHLATGQVPHGLGSLFGSEHPLAVPVLTIVSAAVAAAGALVRWRVSTLEARVAMALQAVAAARVRHPRILAPAREWPLVGALRGHLWLLVRLLAGRAPPALA